MCRSPGAPASTRAVDSLARTLFAPLLTGIVGDGWRVLGWDAEQGLSLTLRRSEATILIELGPHDPARPCYARTRRFNAFVRHAIDGGRPLSPEERAVVDVIIRTVERREARLPAVERPSTGRRTSVREILVERVLMPEGGDQYYLNPYVGCVIGCEFCYVADFADLSRGLEGLPRLPWGRYLDVKVNAPEVLREEVRRFRPGTVRLSPILTDPYQPAERHHRVTRECLRVLLEAGFTPVILTRSARVVDDLDLLARFPRAAVGFSIPTDDDRIRRQFEPGADPIADRLEALAACARAGLRTFAMIQPMLPMDPDRLVGLVAAHVQAVRIDRMHQIDGVRHLYEAAGCPEAASEAFFARVGASLRAGFGRCGVAIDDLDDVAALMGLRG